MYNPGSTEQVLYPLPKRFLRQNGDQDLVCDTRPQSVKILACANNQERLRYTFGVFVVLSIDHSRFFVPMTSGSVSWSHSSAEGDWSPAERYWASLPETGAPSCARTISAWFALVPPYALQNAKVICCNILPPRNFSDRDSSSKLDQSPSGKMILESDPSFNWRNNDGIQSGKRPIERAAAGGNVIK